ncbi:MAG: hypothetical protein QG608_1368, partial [Actinomycetota bacterium]|nr:hypothetical protein [Actinomycetota bacterium]
GKGRSAAGTGRAAPGKSAQEQSAQEQSAQGDSVQEQVPSMFCRAVFSEAWTVRFQWCLVAIHILE